jgi:hypothetical protein
MVDGETKRVLPPIAAAFAKLQDPRPPANADDLCCGAGRRCFVLVDKERRGLLASTERGTRSKGDAYTPAPVGKQSEQRADDPCLAGMMGDAPLAILHLGPLLEVAAPRTRSATGGGAAGRSASSAERGAGSDEEADGADEEAMRKLLREVQARGPVCAARVLWLPVPLLALRSAHRSCVRRAARRASSGRSARASAGGA